MDLKEKGFQVPENYGFDSESLTNTYGKFTAEAFERGFGTTLGNALRRILLSSIEGAAVTSIKIPGVLHEYSEITGVKEDVVDIILNLKQLRFKINSDSETVRITKKGPGDVKGSDIEGNVEVLNMDQHIATLDKGVELSIEMTVEKGKGYVTSELNKKEDQTVDTLVIDSIFTPIKKVNFWVEGARVGRSTDYDKLIMEIWTDGSITPQGALTEASNILKGYISIFSDDGISVEDVPSQIEGVEAVEYGDEEREVVHDIASDDPVELNENLLKNVEELELSVRSYNCLKNANIKTLADLVQKTENEMLRTKNFGRKSLNEIKELITSMGLSFNMRVDPEELQKLSIVKRADNAS